jgi:hypothetical protein
MRQRTSPRTSGAHRACIDVHRACPSPPLYPPVRDTHARASWPFVRVTQKLRWQSAALRGAQTARYERGPGKANAPPPFSGGFSPILKRIADVRPTRERRRLRQNRGRELATIEPDETCRGLWRVRLPDRCLTDMLNLSPKDAALNRHREAA